MAVAVVGALTSIFWDLIIGDSTTNKGSCPLGKNRIVQEIEALPDVFNPPSCRQADQVPLCSECVIVDNQVYNVGSHRVSFPSQSMSAEQVTVLLGGGRLDDSNASKAAMVISSHAKNGALALIHRKFPCAV